MSRYSQEEIKMFLDEVIEHIVVSDEDSMATLEIYEDLRDLVEKEKPIQIIDDNLCPNCKVSVHLLIGRYCQHCGQALFTSQNKSIWKYHWDKEAQDE